VKNYIKNYIPRSAQTLNQHIEKMSCNIVNVASTLRNVDSTLKRHCRNI